jgi:hypothetical protein
MVLLHGENFQNLLPVVTQAEKYATYSVPSTQKALMRQKRLNRALKPDSIYL